MITSYWAVAKTKPCRERWAAENISRQGHEFYLPMISERMVIKRRLTDRRSPLFPNYLFVRITDNDWRYLLGTFGIQKPLLDAEGPAKIPDAIIERIRQTEKSGIVQLPEKGPQFVYGQRVKVHLPTGQVELGIYQGASVKERVNVLLNILGHKTRVEIASDQLEAAA